MGMLQGTCYFNVACKQKHHFSLFFKAEILGKQAASGAKAIGFTVVKMNYTHCCNEPPNQD